MLSVIILFQYAECQRVSITMLSVNIFTVILLSLCIM